MNRLPSNDTITDVIHKARTIVVTRLITGHVTPLAGVNHTSATTAWASSNRRSNTKPIQPDLALLATVSEHLSVSMARWHTCDTSNCRKPFTNKAIGDGASYQKRQKAPESAIFQVKVTDHF